MYRSNDRIIAGVCGGIAEQLGWSAIPRAHCVCDSLNPQRRVSWNAGVSRIVVSHAGTKTVVTTRVT